MEKILAMTVRKGNKRSRESRAARRGRRVVQNERDSDGCGRKKQPKRKHRCYARARERIKRPPKKLYRLLGASAVLLPERIKSKSALIWAFATAKAAPRASMPCGDARLQTNKQTSRRKQQFPTGEEPCAKPQTARRAIFLSAKYLPR